MAFPAHKLLAVLLMLATTRIKRFRPNPAKSIGFCTVTSELA